MKTRIYNTEHTDATTLNAISTAISYEKYDMLVSKASKRISTLSNWIEGKGQHEYSDAQIDGFKAEKADLEKKVTEYQTIMEEAEEVHSLVVEEVGKATRSTADGSMEVSNSETAIRNCLRLNAVWDDSSLMSYALIGTDKLLTDEFVNQMNTIHDPSQSTEDGAPKLTEAQVTAYNKARKSLEKYLGTLVALPVETTYNRAIKVKLNHTDLRLIHDQYVTGVKNLFDTEHCTGQEVRFALKVGKNGTVNATKFWKVVATQLQQYVC